MLYCGHMALLYIVRHGESTANVQGLFSSKPNDTFELTETGVKQILDASDHLPDEIAAVYTSPLLRTIQSAKLITVQYKGEIPFEIDNRLREIDYGIYSGQPNNEALNTVRMQQKEGNLEVRFGETGENRREITARVQEFLDDVATLYPGDKAVVVVSHGSIVRWIERLALPDDASAGAVANGSIRIVRT